VIWISLIDLDLDKGKGTAELLELLGKGRVRDVRKWSGLEPLQLGDGGPVFDEGFGTCVHRGQERRLGVRSIAFQDVPLANVELRLTFLIGAPHRRAWPVGVAVAEQKVQSRADIA